MLAGSMKLRTFLLIATALMITFGVLAIKACKSGAKTDENGYVASAAPVASGSAPAPTPPPTPQPAVGSAGSGGSVMGSGATPTGDIDLPERPYDRVVISYRGRSIDSDRIKDATKGEAWKVSVYQDAGQSTVNRIKVDANRNNKWDDKITFDGDKVKLQHASKDDENYDEEYRWEGTGWRKKK
ncbi:MAG: hypothetical protein K8W52_46730 [Deltaproteobacteria bacterium]|nr:hypothetical protein [Deltaproteobacteria bacterium]